MTSEALVCAYALNGDAQCLSWDQIDAPQSADAPLWIHLDRREAATGDWLANKSGIEPIIVQALLAEETRPRCETFDEGILVILRGLNLNPGADPLDMISVRIWIEKDRIISTRGQRLMAVQDVRSRIERHVGPRSTAALLVSMADGLISRIGDYIDRLEAECDELEAAAEDKSILNAEDQILDLRRHAVMVKRYFSPQREAIGRLLNARFDWFGEDPQMELREVQDRTVRYLEELEAVRERSTLIQERLANQRAERTGRTMYVLTLIAAIMLPLGFIVGLLGANVGGIPGTESENAFWYLCAALVAVAAVQVYWFRKLKWI